MIVNKEFISSAVGTSISAIGTAIQTDEVLRYFSLIITILGGLVTLLTGIIGLIVRIRRWCKKAMEDGKIDNDELEELGSIVKEGVDEGKQTLETINKKKKGETK